MSNLLIRDFLNYDGVYYEEICFNICLVKPINWNKKWKQQVETKMRGVETEWRRFGDVARGMETGPEDHSANLVARRSLYGAQGSSATPPSYNGLYSSKILFLCNAPFPWGCLAPLSQHGNVFNTNQGKTLGMLDTKKIVPKTFQI